ncbi:MAG TPA: LysR family transcriptional regulator [Burkholderiales bacterium]|nr:LysR family transcriptional regulator [Burkholderiales bacterium]
MDLDDIAVFVKVVEAGSFSQAARLLGMPNTTVSAKVARLEKRLGVTLIRRTTRKLHITRAGQAYYERCRRGLTEIETAEAQITSAATEPRGTLRISVNVYLAHSVLPALIAEYTRRYPGTNVEVRVANGLADLLAEGIDLGIVAAELKDSTLVARRYLTFSFGLWASPHYLEKHGTPRSPPDLKHHEVLAFSPLWKGRIRLNEGRHSFELPARGRISVDDPEALREFLVAGCGIGTLPDILAREAARAGELVRVLPRWSSSAGAVSFVYPSQPFVPAKVRAFIDLALEAEKHLK